MEGDYPNEDFGGEVQEMHGGFVSGLTMRVWKCFYCESTVLGFHLSQLI
jgi:hypothetical protein